MDLISREAAIDAVKHAWAKGLEPSQYIEIIPTVPAVPLDKLCELLSNITVRTPCILCEKIVPEWCKEHNPNDCPTWKVILTKWMEEQDAKEET